MNLQDIITLITLIIGLIGAIAALIPTLIKLCNSLKEIAENKNWNKLVSIAMEAMKDVEKHYRENPNMTGEQKLNMALEIIKQSSTNLDVTINDKDINDLIKYINDTIKWANDMKK